MTLYGGIDLHSNNHVVVLLDEGDEVVLQRRLPNDLRLTLQHLGPYREVLQGLAVESTYNWYWLVDGLMDAGYRVHLVNTAAVKRYEGLKYSDDVHDARWLAHLLRLGVLPQGYIYPRAERALRDLLRKRAQLVRLRTTQVLSIQNLVSRNTGHSLSANAIKGWDAAAVEAVLPEPMLALAVEANRELLQHLEARIHALEVVIQGQLKGHTQLALLKGVPGVGSVLALTILLETGDITRFARVGQFASYCRCVDSQRVSNGKKKGEGNTRNGNRYLAWAFVEAAHFAVRYYRPVQRFYQRKRAQRGPVVAIKAVAHKLARASYYVLRDEVAFDMQRAFA